MARTFWNTRISIDDTVWVPVTTVYQAKKVRLWNLDPAIYLRLRTSENVAGSEEPIPPLGSDSFEGGPYLPGGVFCWIRAAAPGTIVVLLTETK